MPTSALLVVLATITGGVGWAADGGAGRPGVQPTSRPTSQPTSQPSSQPSQPTSQPSSRPGARRPAWTPKLSATVKPVVVAVGDPVTVRIKVRHRKEVSVTLPLRLELGKFSELRRGATRREVGKEGHIPEVEQTFSLEVAAYELGEVTLPPVEVTALGPGGEMVTLKTAAMPIRVRSVMANEPKPKLKKLAKPISVWQRDWLLLYLIIGVGAVGLIVIVTLVVSRRLRARREALRPPPPPTPPHVIALGRLAELDVEALIAEERYKELHLQLSEILRGYIGGRWGFDAMEMTTTEIRQGLLARGAADPVRARIDELLSAWDLVKFAKFRPTPEAAREAADDAEGFVRETMRPSAPPAAASAPATAPATGEEGAR